MILAEGLNSIIRADGSPEYSMLAMIVTASKNFKLCFCNFVLSWR